MDPGPSPALPEPPAENQPPVEVPPVDLDAPSGPGGLDAPTYGVAETPAGDIIIDEHTKQIVDLYAMGVPIIDTRRIFAPSLWKLFNSYSRKELPQKNWPVW